MSFGSTAALLDVGPGCSVDPHAGDDLDPRRGPQADVDVGSADLRDERRRERSAGDLVGDARAVGVEARRDAHGVTESLVELEPEPPLTETVSMGPPELRSDVRS